MTVPCCGCSLQTGTKIVAILQIIGAVLLFILTALGFAGLASLSSTDDTYTSNEKTVLWVAMALLLVVCIASFVLGLILYQGASKRNLKKVNIWFFVNIVLLVISFISMIMDIVNGRYFSIISFAVSIYFLVVVYCFKKELETEANGGYPRNQA